MRNIEVKFLKELKEVLKTKNGIPELLHRLKDGIEARKFVSLVYKNNFLISWMGVGCKKYPKRRFAENRWSK